MGGGSPARLPESRGFYISHGPCMVHAQTIQCTMYSSAFEFPAFMIHPCWTTTTTPWCPSTHSGPRTHHPTAYPHIQAHSQHVIVTPYHHTPTIASLPRHSCAMVYAHLHLHHTQPPATLHHCRHRSPLACHHHCHPVPSMCHHCRRLCANVMKADVELFAKFLSFAAARVVVEDASPNLSILLSALHHVTSTYLKTKDVHSLSVSYDTSVHKDILMAYFAALATIKHCLESSKVPRPPPSALHTATANSKVSVYALFGGPGTNGVYFDELQSLYDIQTLPCPSYPHHTRRSHSSRKQGRCRWVLILFNWPRYTRLA